MLHHSRFTIRALVVGTLLGFNAVVLAEKPVDLPGVFATTIAQNPAPALATVGGREYKILTDASKLPSVVEEGFTALWSALKLAAIQHGFVITDKPKAAMKLDVSTKDYRDTAEQALWNKGYLIRLSVKFKDGKPDDVVGVTVKAMHASPARTLGTPLRVVGVDKVKTEAEENVGFLPGGKLGGYIEKGASFSVAREKLGAMTLGDFGALMPELLDLGVAPETPLISQQVFAYRVKPGTLALPGLAEPVGITLEAWSRSQSGAPFLVDYSFGYDGVDFYAVTQAHAAAERFMQTAVKLGMAHLSAPDANQWGGSKVRKLLNRPAQDR